MTVTPVPHLVVLGDLVLDIVVTGERAPARGTDVPGTITFRAGGSAANTARAFAALGGRATFVGSVGRDAWGPRLTRALRESGVRVAVTGGEGPTARLLALVGPDGERSFVTQRGAADALTAADVDARWPRGADAVHLPAYSLLGEPLAGASRRAAALAHGHGALVSVDLASALPLRALGRRRARAAIASVQPDVLFTNEDEARALYRSHAATRLLELSPVVVIKQGAAGCRVLANDRRGSISVRLAVPTRPVTTADTTGAGDAFDAGFLHALLAWRGPAPGSGTRWPPGSGTLRQAARAGHRAATALLRAPRLALPDG